ncbi:Fungal Zn(2)-Cys(6) binuclear cluster domain-containing protein [Penicillium ucsense]|uniref:Fungal Zn(2)-Cys(6) binuclear cluster domain-containing protein n=1 Tax=Penicillium ucsense TaxID=2839758 RepID=A0A8J8WKD6_9EURO|nr:Fungal Zn(2)-Cys(6) binuclear cluster domain-containing protein [Penicillium ucsense]KAF7734744.1 Fungal Zn(2)-Cys(6) binuclear cluster domain-containing protein [Penicillium ucsense]
MSDRQLPGFPYASNILPNEPTTSEQSEPAYTFAPNIVPSGLSPYTSELLAGRRDSSDLAPEPGQGSRNPKVPIPRATRPVAYSTGGRVSRACEACRDQKAKCSGHRPSCHRCQESGVACSYGDRKREKMLKQLDELTAQLNVYETLVRELYPRLEPTLVQHVDRTLGRHSGMSRPKSFSEGETSNPATSITNYTEEDFNRDEKVRATGFVGAHSELAWLYKLKRQLDSRRSTFGGDGFDQESVSISSLSYFEDDVEIINLDRTELSKRPPVHIADHFVGLYFRTVHPAFPIIGKGVFLTQYQSFYMDATVRPGKRWVAVLNLIFAIAAAHAQLIDDDVKVEGDNHLSYFTRGWRLGMDSISLLDHVSLQQVQVEGLVAFYLFCTGQVNRAWRINGIAIRSATAMGLNLRSETRSVPLVSKETRYRVWWALSTLDAGLCLRTGRPPDTDPAFCTTPLPIPFIEEDFDVTSIIEIVDDFSVRSALVNSLLGPGNDETADAGNIESSPNSPAPPRNYQRRGKKAERVTADLIETMTPNSFLAFLYGLDLDRLTRDAVQTLYAPSATGKSWIEMEVVISNLNANADAWLSRLPTEFQISKLADIGHDPFVRQRADVGFRFYSAKLVITQPCLSQLAYHSPSANARAGGTFCDTMAAICVQMACEMWDMLPDNPNITWLVEVSPWWCVLHYFMQSVTVILTQLFHRTKPQTPESADLVRYVEKALRWLHAMSGKDLASKKAWLVCMDILSRHGREHYIRLDNMP